MTSDEYVVNELWESKRENASLTKQVEELKAEFETFLKLKETIKRIGLMKKYSYNGKNYISFKSVDDTDYDAKEKADFDFLTSIIDFDKDFEEEPEGENEDD